MERYELPDGWEWSTLGECCLINSRDPNLKELSNGTLVSFVPMAAVDANQGVIANPVDRPFNEVRKGFTPFSDGDVIFAKITPSMENGKAAIASGLTNGFGFGSTEFHVMRPQESVIAEWVFYFIRQQSFRDEAKGNFAGTAGQLRVPEKFILNADIPLPPIPEQQRIVAKIESLFEQSRAARAALMRVPALMAQFRRAVLASAMSGRLTEDWRKQNSTIENANDLLQRILVRRLELAQRKTERTHIEELLKCFSADELYSADLPESWAYTVIDNIGMVCNGSTPSRKMPGYWNGNIPWISSGEVQNCIIRETREKITQEGYDNSSVRILPKGTVLLAMIGEGKTRGQSAVLEIEACINQNMAAIVLDHNLIESKYLWYWLQSIYDANRQVGSGSGPQALNCQRVREIPFALPPLGEQVEIVQYIEALFAQADIVEQAASVSLRRAGQLEQSILARAFRGGL
jgi:type I restriction enzyme S subunit